MAKQRTIRKQITISGVGLHTGAKVNMTFTPAASNHGYIFQRIDLPNQPIVHALVDRVVDTARGTTIAENGATVHTVEHTLAALVGNHIDNVLIKIDGPEPPAMDGSSIDFAEAILAAEPIDQAEDRKVFVLDTPISYEESDRKVKLSVSPSDNWQTSVEINFDSPSFSPQKAELNHLNDFTKEIASCRTFCFLHEVEPLLKAGLIKGGTLNSAVVIVDRAMSSTSIEHLRELFKKPDMKIDREGVLNEGGFRYSNEPARHKLLDIIGDLALVGMPIQANIHAIRPGHKANVALAKKIRERINLHTINR